MSKEELRQQRKQQQQQNPLISTEAEDNSVPNQYRHQQTTEHSLNHSNRHILENTSNTSPSSVSKLENSKNSLAHTVPIKVQNYNMAMHNFGPNPVNTQQDQLKNQSNESAWHLNAESSINNNSVSTNNNNTSNIGDSQATTKLTTSPSGSAFNNRQQTSLQVQQQQHQQYGVFNPQVPPNLQTSLASRVDQIIRNTLNESPASAYAPLTSNSSNPLTSSHGGMPSPSTSTSLVINQPTSLANFTGPQNIHVSSSGSGPNQTMSMSPLTTFHGSSAPTTSIGDTTGNLLSKTPAHSASHSTLMAGAALSLSQTHPLQRPHQLAHSHQPPTFGLSRSPSGANNSTMIPQAAHGNHPASHLPKLGVTSTTSSDHNNHIHIPNSTNQSEHVADFSSRLHSMGGGGPLSGSSKMPFLPPNRLPMTTAGWPAHLNQPSDNAQSRLPMLHGMNTSISQQAPLSAALNSMAVSGASSSGMSGSSNSNFMIGSESDNIYNKLNAAIKGDQRHPSSLPSFSAQDGRSYHHPSPSGPTFVKQGYPGLEHFRVPITVAETALKVQQTQQINTGMGSIPETVAFFALNLTGANIPGTNKLKRVVLMDSELRSTIEQGELYTRYESVAYGILTNQVHVPGFNIADYLSRDKFPPQEMDRIENIHGKIDAYQLICLMEFIRFKYSPRTRAIPNDLNMAHLHQQSTDPSDFRSSNMNPRDMIPTSQPLIAPRIANGPFLPMSGRLDPGLAHMDRSRCSSQSPSDNMRSQSMNSSRLPLGQPPLGPGTQNPMVSGNPSMPSPYGNMSQGQKMNTLQSYPSSPLNRSSPFQTPISIGMQPVTRPPRSHSTIGSLGLGFDGSTSMGAPLPRQPPAAHQSSSRPNLPGIMDLSAMPTFPNNAPVAAHMSSKAPQTPKLPEPPMKSSPKSSPHSSNPYLPRPNARGQSNSTDQMGSPMKNADVDGANNLPMYTLLSMRQQQELALRRSMTPQFSPSYPSTLNHPNMVMPRGPEPSRIDFGPRSPSQVPLSGLSNPELFRVPNGPLGYGMPPPNSNHARPYDYMKTSGMPQSSPTTIGYMPSNDAQMKQYSDMIAAYQHDQMNLMPDKASGPSINLINTNQQNPNQVFYPGSAGPSGLLDNQQSELPQQRPPAISPKQSNQRSIITGSASANAKKSKKSKSSPPISSQSTIDTKPSVRADVEGVHIAPDGNAPNASCESDSQRGDNDSLETDKTIDPNDQLSKLAAAAAAAIPAVSANPGADEILVSANGEELAPPQTCAGNIVARGVGSAVGSDEIVASNAQDVMQIADKDAVNISCNTNLTEADTGLKCNEASQSVRSESKNTQPIEEPSKYKKLFTKKAWLQNYDLEDQSKSVEDPVTVKMAINNTIESEQTSIYTKDANTKEDLKTTQPNQKLNGGSKGNKSSKNESKKKSNVNRNKSSSMTSLKTNRVANSKNIENDSEETTASTSDLDETTDEADSMKSSSDKKLRRMPRRKVKANLERESSHLNPISKSKSPKDIARKRVKKERTAVNASDNDSNSNTAVKRKYNSDDESAKGKTKKIKDNNGKTWDKANKTPTKGKRRPGEKFLQTCPCYDIVPKNIRCMECRRVRQSSLKNDKVLPSKQTSRTNWDDFCRFYEFRKLRYNKSDQIVVAGFSEMTDAKDSDKQLWLPITSEVPRNFNHKIARFILSWVGVLFCDLVLQERAVQTEYESRIQDKKITWKRAVNGLRELCDVCSTTLFNCHFVCEKCGFVVCIDCHCNRLKQQSSMKLEDDSDIKSDSSPPTINENTDEPVSDSSNKTKKNKKDSSGWIYCAKNEEHSADKMILAQIIAGDCLEEVWTLLHETRIKLGLEPCPCRRKRVTDEQALLGDENGEPPKSDLSTDSKGTHSTLKGLLLANKSSPTNESSIDGSSKSQDAMVSQKQCKDSLHDTKVFEFTNEDDSQDDSRQVSAAIEECIASLSAKGSDENRNLTIEPNISKDFVKPDDNISSYLCDGDLLILHDPKHKDNTRLFRDHWKLGKPVLVRGIHRLMSIDRWLPQFFAIQFGDYRSDLVDCRNGDIHRQSMKKYWEGFEPNVNIVKKKSKDDSAPSYIAPASNEEPSAITTSYYCGSALWRLKDWPPGQDFNEILPNHYDDFMNNLPLKSYTTRTGKLNLACRLPKEMLKPDLGPKMYSAYGTTKFPERGTTNLHLDISDAVNVMVYVGGASSYQNGLLEYQENFEKTIDDAYVDDAMKDQIRESKLVPGALWHIFKPSDASKMREFLNKVADERKISPEKRTDPIHDQIWYLDQDLLDRLYNEYKVKSYPILQCMGDAILIPAGAPHQVKNLQNCIKVANDFVSPENVRWCLKLTDEFRNLPETHINQEDKLQIKNILYHCVKESLWYIKMYDSGKINNKSGEVMDSDSCDDTDIEKTDSESSSVDNDCTNGLRAKKLES